MLNLGDLTPAHFEIGRKAVEDQLVMLRDERISLLNRNNGLVIKEIDGRDSWIIRLGTEEALEIAVKAIMESEEAHGRS